MRSRRDGVAGADEIGDVAVTLLLTPSGESVLASPTWRPQHGPTAGQQEHGKMKIAMKTGPTAT
jgi:hypothetical protein